MNESPSPSPYMCLRIGGRQQRLPCSMGAVWTHTWLSGTLSNSAASLQVKSGFEGRELLRHIEV